MTQQEFETRTGLNVSASEFDYIHRVYMAAGSLDKDAFCKEWKASHKAIRTSAILCAIVEENEQNVGYIGSLQSQLKCEKENYKAYSEHMADFLILQAEKWSASDLREKAIKMVGTKEYIRRRLNFGFGLWEKDKQALTQILAAE